MKGNKISSILAILIMLSGALAIVPIAHSVGDPLGSHPVGACTPSVRSYVNSSGTHTVPAPSYPTISPTPNLHFVWGTNGSAADLFTVDVYAFNISAADPLMGWSIGFFYNPTIVWVIRSQTVAS
jgi:hypothetical protein